MSTLAAGVNKKKKKSDPKPQAQINKCNNEKRRREQENIYIEELAELISANFADMSSLSVKPDKCAILQETVNQIRSIKQQESASQSSDPVQQGEVSSSRPTAILSNEVFGPLLLEALEGFLFVVNSEGKVAHVTDNVITYIKFSRDEVLGKSIYNFIHHGDHNRFSSNHQPMSITWPNEPANRSRSFSCRFLIKPDEQDESIEEKQQRVSRYELMYISSTKLRDPVIVANEEGGDSGPGLLCVASRISHRDSAPGSSIEQFTTKLDTSGKIIGVDTSGVSATYSQFLNKDLMGRTLQDLCPQQEVHKLSSHLRDTLSAGQATSVIYRLRLGSQDKYVHVQTKSKLFKVNPHSANDIDFMMATHSIIGEQETTTGSSDPGGGNNSVGGPLMTSVVNGTRNSVPVSSGSDGSTTSSNNVLLNNNTSSFSIISFENDFNFEYIPTSTWELEPSSWTETRPESRQSVTSVSTPTPRPPSAPAYSPAATVSQSPLAAFVSQASPTNVPNPPTPANPYSSTFPFSPLTEPNFSVEDQKDTKVNVLEEASNMMADSGRLRNLLTKPPNSVDSSANDFDSRNKNRILKGLLNQQDEDENKSDNRNSPRGHRVTGSTSSELPKTSTSGGNNMLLKLLNEKSDDDDLEARAGLKTQSELLDQLLKDNGDEKKPEPQSHNDNLLRSLGFTNSPSPPGEPGRARKRPSDDRDDHPSKRSSDGSQVSSSGTGSRLCDKNKMLASLLAKQPNNLQPIPPMPASVISATPQEKLPKIGDLHKNLTNNNNRVTSNVQQQQQNAISNARTPRMSIRPLNTNYLNQMLTPNENMQRTQTRQYTQADTGNFTTPTTSSVESLWDSMQTSSDPVLSDLLDQVIDIVPENVISNNADLLNLLEDAAQNNNYSQRELSEKMAITIIQKSLMQCESAVKGPSSPTISLPGATAYSTAVMTTLANQTGGFPPPPNYPRTGFNMQRAPVRPGGQQYSGGPLSAQQQLLLQQQQQRKQMIQQQQEQHKRRLLQQQQQQQLLIPSNAAAEINSLQNIDSLLNNTVAPNVTLQRSTSVPESQLSPNFAGQINQQNQRINNQQPYSPHSQMTSPLGQQANFPQTTSSNFQQGGARLSPHPPFNQQLSPRQGYPQGNGQNANWQQAQPRLSVQQQQNPMLNAQLTQGSYVSAPNNRTFAVQRSTQQQQRTIGSPGSAGTRQSPFQGDSFPPPASPNSSFNQNQYLRLQRTNSAPTATTQLPGGLGSPRPYGRDHPPLPYPSIQPPHHLMMYQQDSQYCYDQTGLQLVYNGADRGRAPPHLQAGVSGGGTTSEYVRQELRAVVGARTGQATQQSTTRTSSQLLGQPNDVDSLSLTFDLPQSGASESPKLWCAMGSDMGSMSPQPATSRNSIEEGRQGDHKSSLLQKLLSE